MTLYFKSVFIVQRDQTADIYLISLFSIIPPGMFSFFVMIMCILSSHSSSIRIRMKISVILWYSVTLSAAILLCCSVSGCSS